MRGYVSTQQLIPKQTITHSRHYRRFRRKKRRAVNTQTYRAPDEAHLEYRNLREQTARNVEIRRLRQMVRFFSGHKESWTRELLWRDLLRQLDGFIPDTRSPIEIDALYKMSELLMNHEATSDLWGSILWVRERRLGDGLRLNEQEHLATLLESRPYVTTLLGNYLFLFLVALQMKYPDLRIDQLQSLWSVMKSWHLKQLGFYLKDVRGVSRPKFDVRAIWPNLNKRASILSQIPLPVQSAVRHGQLLVAPNGDEYNYWLFLEDHYDQTLLRSGFWIGRSPLDPDPSVKWSESDTSVIADHATDVEPEEVRNLLTCRMEETEYVWLFAEENWNPLGKLSIIPRKRGAITNIRGLQVVPVDSSGMPAAPVGVSVPSHLSSRIRRELSEISNMQQHIISVECILSIDSDLYSLSLQSDGEELDTRCVELTSELLQVLRRPLVEGVPLQSTRNPNHYFTWDPYKNIEYAELQLLRPYVERKTPFIHIRAPLPFSCQDLLEQSSESVSIQVTHDNAVCPVADGSSNVHGVCWRLVLIGDYYDADLVTLVEQPVLDLDVVSLMKAGEVFLDGARYELEIDFENDPATREGIVFRESRLIARHLGLKPVTPGVSLGMENERLTWTASRSRKIIEIPMVSDVIRERVDTLKLQVPEDDDWSIEEVFETAEDMIGEFVEQHFGDSEEPEVRIVGLDSLYENIRLQLLHIKLEEVESVLVDEDSLNLKVELCRQASSADPAYAVNLAETLYELALFHLRNRAFGDAKQAIDECIEVYESYYETWREEWVKEKLRSARSLKTRVERQP